MANVGDVVKRGDHVKVKVLSISGTKLSLSMRVSVCDAAIALHPSLLHCTYCKRQKLSEIKVSWFTGFHSNVGKTFAVFASSVWIVLKKAIAQLKHSSENFCYSSKIHKIAKLSCVTFAVYSIQLCAIII